VAKTKLYIAGGSSEAALINDYIKRLEATGLYEVTLNWAEPRLAELAAGKTDVTHTPADRVRIALTEFNAVKAAQVLWLAMPLVTSFGCGFEYGCFVGLSGGTRIVSGPWRNSIFTELMDERFDEHEDAFSWLVANAS
jgi:hypothetical protein